MRDPKTSRGVSEVAAEILIIILVIIVAAIAFAAFTGALNPLYTTKSVYVAGSAKIDTLPQPGGLKDDVLTYLPEAGDAFYLTGQTNGANGTPVTFNLISPSCRQWYQSEAASRNLCTVKPSISTRTAQQHQRSVTTR